MINGHKPEPMFNKMNQILPAGPTHLSNIAKILLQHFFKMHPPTITFVPAQGVCSNLKSNLLFGRILGTSSKWLLKKKTQRRLNPKYFTFLLLNTFQIALLLLKPEVEAR